MRSLFDDPLSTARYSAADGTPVGGKVLTDLWMGEIIT